VDVTVKRPTVKKNIASVTTLVYFVHRPAIVVTAVINKSNKNVANTRFVRILEP
jgi:hypothetical protein